MAPPILLSSVPGEEAEGLQGPGLGGAPSCLVLPAALYTLLPCAQGQVTGPPGAPSRRPTWRGTSCHPVDTGRVGGRTIL